jgi:hypothetical protein
VIAIKTLLFSFSITKKGRRNPESKKRIKLVISTSFIKKVCWIGGFFMTTGFSLSFVQTTKVINTLTNPKSLPKFPPNRDYFTWVYVLIPNDDTLMQQHIKRPNRFII